ncbi:MAG: hypothetical protein ACP5VE_02415 [Chthonomonadales bacterium]
MGYRNLILAACPTLAAFCLAASRCAAGAAPKWTALVSASGSITLRQDRQTFAVMEPGLFEAVWQGATLEPPRVGVTHQGDTFTGAIRAPGGGLVTTTLRIRKEPAGLHLEYHLVPQTAIRLNSLHIGIAIPVSHAIGGSYAVDGQRAAFPAQFTSVMLHSGPAKVLELDCPPGAPLVFRFDTPTPVLVQDDRQWGPTFTLRFGPQMNGAEEWPAGKDLAVALTLTSPGGIAMEEDGPVTVEAGTDWIPLTEQPDVLAGSALDLSRVIPWHAPAGSLGRVLASGSHFVFADRPSKPVRFYGVNLTFGSQYLTHDEADRLAIRLRRLGYNAVRLHHYEGMLVDRRAGPGVRLDPQQLDRLDYLFYALKKQGIYITTDLFVSRPVANSEIWLGAEGDIGMDEYKMAVPVNDRAFADYCAFASALLEHRNPYTGTTWAQDPALAWLSLINEGNPGNFVGLLTGNLGRDYALAWNKWLQARYPTRDALANALGAQPSDPTAQPGRVPIPTQQDASRRWVLFNVFLADSQRSFFHRTRDFLRNQLHCRALLTNNNAWTNPLQMEAVRSTFDYVDDHFYVDHPQFLQQPWRLPSRCSNESPVSAGAPGGTSCAFIRLLDRPFTCTEFNYAGPSRYRGVGGILTGALGALQDWAGIWRFDYASNGEALFSPRPAGYFDLVTDPLNQAADRAAIFLFRRGDLQQAPHSIGLALSSAELLGNPQSARAYVPGWTSMAWITKVGGLPASGNQVRPDEVLSTSGANPPAYASGASEHLLRVLQEHGWSKESILDFRANRLRSETGQVSIDASRDVLTVDTPRTEGGFAPSGGRIETAHASITIRDTPATVWVSSLDDRPISRSRRLLVTHLTDLQNTGARFADKDRRILTDWGRLPYLVRAGRAEVALKLDGAADAIVWGLDTSGRRTERVPARVIGGALLIPLNVNNNGSARMLYEVVVGRRR